MDHYDLIVIGGGPGGYLCAQKGAQAGLRVGLCESRELGGTCLNEGCIPTKSLLHCAKQWNNMLHCSDYAISAQDLRYDHRAALARKEQIVATLVSGVAATLDSCGVEVFRDHAVILGKDESGFSIFVAGTRKTCKNLVVATGSSPLFPPISGLPEAYKKGFVSTNQELLSDPSEFETLVCIGGGIIGLEMACYYATIGKNVHIVEMLPKIAGSTDKDICSTLMKTYKKLGMQFHLEAKVDEIRQNELVYSDAKGTHSIACDKILLAAGRRPNLSGFGLQTLHVTCQNGAIATDECLRTNVPNLYAIGDCNGKVMLAHTAYREAEAVIHTILGTPDAIRYDTIPSVIYTTPEVAFVGMTEEQAKAAGIRCQVVKAPMMLSGRYVCENGRGNGFCKIVYDIDRQVLLGVHIIGSYASELICAAAIMLQQQLPLEALKRIVFPHPTVSEIYREAFSLLN